MNPKQRISILFLSLSLLVFMSSCSVTRNLKEGEFLLTKNVIKFKDKNPGINVDDISIIPKPKPNSRFLGFIAIKLRLYNLGLKGRENSKFRTWLRDKVGERPSLYEKGTAVNSATEIEQYLAKIGYFNSHVEFEPKFHGRKRVKVIYTLDPAKPYKLRQIALDVPDSTLKRYMLIDQDLSLISKGKIFNAFDLEDERARLSELLQNNGYYYFDKTFIYYEVDSALNSHQMDITIKVKPGPNVNSGDSSRVTNLLHRRYFINDIYINTDYTIQDANKAPSDTLKLGVKKTKKDTAENFYYILYNGRLRIHPIVLTQSVFMKSGDPYRFIDVRKTKARIGELGFFGYTNIRFKEVNVADSADENGRLNCLIDLSTRKLQSSTIELEGTNTGGRPGIGANYTYQNNNIFRGSEIFRLRAHFAMEAQKSLIGKTDGGNNALSFFNTKELGLEASIDFPKFLVPFKPQRFPKYFHPKSNLRLGVGFETRPEYKRMIYTLLFGYDWKESDTKRHLLYPIDINIVDVSLDPKFKNIIDNEPNDRIRNQYTNHLIMGLRYSFIFNNQNIRKLKNFIYFRANFEAAGNLMQLLNVTFNGTKDTAGYYKFINIRYSQYVRSDVDFRFYNVITRNTTLVYRFYGGLGIPYGNANVLPLEKGFYAGGANGMRAWLFRLLGPGAYSDGANNFDRMGDMQLEGNIEYRFPVYKFFKGAFFLDAGNIWLLNENSSYPGGKFNPKNFYKEIAIDGGFGFRFDFNFFILRIDAAVPLRDPSKSENARWVISKLHPSNILFNFGIGYPF